MPQHSHGSSAESTGATVGAGLQQPSSTTNPAGGIGAAPRRLRGQTGSERARRPEHMPRNYRSGSLHPFRQNEPHDRINSDGQAAGANRQKHSEAAYRNRVEVEAFGSSGANTGYDFVIRTMKTYSPRAYPASSLFCGQCCRTTPLPTPEPPDSQRRTYASRATGKRGGGASAEP